jgi:hypothetical protein
MPIGTGNDLSQVLGFGNKMNLLRMDNYIKTILDDSLPEKKLDVWKVNVKNTVPCLNSSKGKKKIAKYKPKNFTCAMTLYMGLGYDAYVIYYFEMLRKYFPMLMISHKLSKLYFALVFLFLAFRSFFRSYISKLYKFFDCHSDLKNLRAKENSSKNDELSSENGIYRLSKMNNIILMNGRSRSGGFKNEWAKSKRAAIQVDGRNVMFKKKSNGEWKSSYEIYEHNGGWLSVIYFFKL